MSSENSVFLEQEKTSTALLNDILDQLKRIPNTTAVVNSINHLNTICVPMIGANKLAQQANGVSGFVPAPSITEAGKFLRGDGTWQTVITSIDPLKTESLVYPTNIINATGYPFVQPSDDTSGTVGTLKYNTNLRFGRHEVTIGSARYAYTLLGIKQDNVSTDAGIEFINSSSSGGSTILFANLSNSNIKVKMPQVDGTLLTDSGFTVNGPVIANSTVTMNNVTTMNHATVMNGVLRINANPYHGGWNQGIRIQSAFDGHALIGLGVSSSDSTVNDSWFIRSDKSAGNNTFSIAYGGVPGSANGSLWTNVDGNWNMTNTLTVSNSINIGSNYSMYSSGNAVIHSTPKPTIAFAGQGGQQVNLLDGATSRFYMDYITIEPLANAYAPLEGGEIQLCARAGGGNYGNISIDNYNGHVRLWNHLNSNRIFDIDFTNPAGAGIISAGAFSTNVYSLMSSSGVVHLTSASNNINISAQEVGGNHPHVEVSAPMTSSAAYTHVGSSERYYRPIIISNTAPSQSDGRDGDVWIQYS